MYSSQSISSFRILQKWRSNSRPEHFLKSGQLFEGFVEFSRFTRLKNGNETVVPTPNCLELWLITQMSPLLFSCNRHHLWYPAE